jgi:hypothetical protein
MKPDLNPDRLANFNLKGTLFLKGFAQAPSDKYIAPLLEKPSGVIATLNLRFFHGPSEVNYSVLLFHNLRDRDKWDEDMSRSSPGWFSPRKHLPKEGVQKCRQGGMINEGLAMPLAALVGNMVISVGRYQHKEMVRRHPETKAQMLSDKELSVVMERVCEELIRRAKMQNTA